MWPWWSWVQVPLLTPLHFMADVVKIDDIENVERVLKNSGVIIYPTDTLYGLGARVQDEKANKRIYEIKERSQKPFLFIANLDFIFSLKDFTDRQKNLIYKLSPLSSTFLFFTEKIFSSYVQENGYVAVRCANTDFLKELVRRAGPITSTSVNISGKKSLFRIKDIIEVFGEKVDLIIDDGDKYSLPSTIIKLDKKIEVVRRGKNIGKIEKILKEDLNV